MIVPIVCDYKDQIVAEAELHLFAGIFFSNCRGSGVFQLKLSYSYLVNFFNPSLSPILSLPQDVLAWVSVKAR